MHSRAPPPIWEHPSLQTYPQAGAGLVADSVPELEYEETINKAAALGRAVDLAEQAFVSAQGH
jgi:anthranilate/para-aminobenzoate synthase component I